MLDDLLSPPPGHDWPTHELERRKRHVIAEARAALAIEPSRARRAHGTERRRLRLVVAGGGILVVLLAGAALGVVPGLSSWFAGWHGPDAPNPSGPDVVIAQGTAGSRWSILAAPSSQGLCLGIAEGPLKSKTGGGGCGYSDIRGRLPRDVRGDPSQKCIGPPASELPVPCSSLPLHWVDAAGGGGLDRSLNRIIVDGPAAARVATVDLILWNGKTVHAHLVEHPMGLAVPLNFYWAVLGPREGVEYDSSGHVAESCGSAVTMVIARDSAGRTLERRIPAWNANPQGDPNGPRPPRPTRAWATGDQSC